LPGCGGIHSKVHATCPAPGVYEDPALRISGQPEQKGKDQENAGTTGIESRTARKATKDPSGNDEGPHGKKHQPLTGVRQGSTDAHGILSRVPANYG
jgi:hypothetical protein